MGRVRIDLVLQIGALAALAASADCGAAIIHDASFFDSTPHTLIDFETFADGTPVVLDPGQLSFIGLGEYGPLGVGFFGLAPAIVHDAGMSVQAALAMGASPTNSLRLFDAGNNNDGLFWIPAVRSVGFFVNLNHTVDVPPPTFSFHDFDGNLLGAVEFSGALIDGRVGVIDYGYVGFAVDGDTPISVMVVNHGSAYSIDDLRFSYVPAPGAGGLASIALACSARRRRRSVG